MSHLAPATEAPDAAMTHDAPDPSILRAERRLRLLAELADIGMDMARTLGARARMEEGHIAAAAAAGEFTIADPDSPAAAKGREPTELFAPLSRAIRLTVALEAKEDKELRDLKAGVRQEREEARVLADARARKAHLGRARQVVLTLAEAEAMEGEELQDVYDTIDDYLEMEAAEFEWPGAEPSLRETVERICKCLSLTPDWSRWTGEGWPGDIPIRPTTARPAAESPSSNGHDQQ